MFLVIEWAVFCLILIFLATQVFYPLLAGRPLFSLFRKTEKAKAEILDGFAESRSELELLELERQRAELKRQINQVKEEVANERDVGGRWV